MTTQSGCSYCGELVVGVLAIRVPRGYYVSPDEVQYARDIFQSIKALVEDEGVDLEIHTTFRGDPSGPLHDS